MLIIAIANFSIFFDLWSNILATEFDPGWFSISFLVAARQRRKWRMKEIWCKRSRNWTWHGTISLMIWVFASQNGRFFDRNVFKGGSGWINSGSIANVSFKVSNMIQSFSSFGLGKVYNYEILWAICGNQMNYINLYHHFLTIIIGNVTIYEMVIRRVVSSDEPSPKDLRNFCRRCRRPSRVVEKKIRETCRIMS